MSTTNSTTIVCMESPNGPAHYYEDVPTESGGFRRRRATRLEWITQELERLADVRANQPHVDPQDFLDALELAETLGCMVDDLMGGG